VSDLLALGVIKTLQAREYGFPAMWRVLSFNDSARGRLMSPPQSLQSRCFYEAGAIVRTEMLLAQLEGQLGAQSRCFYLLR